jgi:serine/threonine-protein kinase HipA
MMPPDEPSSPSLPAAAPARNDTAQASRVAPDRPREPVASINQVSVGVLRAANDIWSFTYAPAWLERPDCYPLSPALPLQNEPVRDGSTRRSVQWYFDNLLPEEGQRVLLARDAHLRNESDAFTLLAHYGAESAGSVTLLAPDAASQHHPHDALRPQPDAQLASRIAALPRTPLTHDASKRMSLAGAAAQARRRVAPWRALRAGRLHAINAYPQAGSPGSRRLSASGDQRVVRDAACGEAAF